MVDFCSDCLVCIAGGFRALDENYGGTAHISIGGILRFFDSMPIAALPPNVSNHLQKCQLHRRRLFNDQWESSSGQI